MPICRTHLVLLSAAFAAAAARADSGKGKLQKTSTAVTQGGAAAASAPVPAQTAPPPASTTPTSVPGPATGALPGQPVQPAPGQPAQPLQAVLPPKPPQPPPVVARFGRFDLDQPLSQLVQLPELRACAAKLTAPLGHADCDLTGPNDEKIAKINLAWDDSKPGGELLALRLTFDAQLALPLTDLEWQLTRGWGAPALEQLRRDHENKLFTLQWEDAEHRATLEASGKLSEPSRAVDIVLERKLHPLTGDLATLRPKPFPNMRIRMARRLDYDGQTYAMVWGTSLSPAQEALGETGPSWSTQRSYVGIFKLEQLALKKHWRALWERTSGDEEDNDLQRITLVETRDVTLDADPDLLVELSCQTCGQSTSEVLVKTIRAGKAVDLLDKHDLYRASVDARPGQIRIREAEGDNTVTVSTYAYDRSKGAFVLAREERE